MKKLLFIDRDGTIISEPEDEQIDSLEKFSFLPGVISALKKIVDKTNFELVMVTNQDGLGTDSFPEDNFWPYQNLMLDILKNEGISFKDILIDKSFPYENKPTRKPGIALLNKYLNGSWNLKESFVIGDRETDIQLAKNIGCKAIFISNQNNVDAVLRTSDWKEIADFLTKTNVKRTTRETDIKMSVNLDGTGKFDFKSGLGFLDHMLELFTRHSSIDLSGTVKGDLHVDEHHTIEDTAIVLGQAISESLGNKKGINRYGFLLPMDEALAQVAVDFSGRSELVWNVSFLREKIGDVPTEMFKHFFKSFCDNAKCNMNIKAEGENEHHKIEAVFKAVARSIRMAVRQNPDNDKIPSTKGVL